MRIWHRTHTHAHAHRFDSQWFQCIIEGKKKPDVILLKQHIESNSQLYTTQYYFPVCMKVSGANLDRSSSRLESCRRVCLDSGPANASPLPTRIGRMQMWPRPNHAHFQLALGGPILSRAPGHVAHWTRHFSTGRRVAADKGVGQAFKRLSDFIKSCSLTDSIKVHRVSSDRERS